MARVNSAYCLGAGYSQNRSSIHQTFTYFIGSHCCDGKLQYSTLVSRTPMVTRSSCRPAQIRAASNDCRIAKAVPGTSSRSIEEPSGIFGPFTPMLLHVGRSFRHIQVLAKQHANTITLGQLMRQGKSTGQRRGIGE